jgi:hypothetical protein
VLAAKSSPRVRMDANSRAHAIAPHVSRETGPVVTTRSAPGTRKPTRPQEPRPWTAAGGWALRAALSGSLKPWKRVPSRWCPSIPRRARRRFISCWKRQPCSRARDRHSPTPASCDRARRFRASPIGLCRFTGNAEGPASCRTLCLLPTSSSTHLAGRLRQAAVSRETSTRPVSSSRSGSGPPSRRTRR